MKQRLWGPKDGMAWNPMCNFPRNSPCPCKSGQKFKRCCLPHIMPTIKIKLAEKLAKIVADPKQHHRIKLTKTTRPVMNERKAVAPELVSEPEVAEVPGA